MFDTSRNVRAVNVAQVAGSVPLSDAPFQLTFKLVRPVNIDQLSGKYPDGQKKG